MSLPKIIAHGIKLKVKSLLGMKDPASKLPLPVAERRDYSLEELASYDGSDPTRPVLLAAKGRIFDVTRGRSFYGPGGPYAVFAGKDCSRALATFSTKAEDCVGSLEGLSKTELEKLEDWVDTFSQKYDELGALV